MTLIIKIQKKKNQKNMLAKGPNYNSKSGLWNGCHLVNWVCNLEKLSAFVMSRLCIFTLLRGYACVIVTRWNTQRVWKFLPRLGFLDMLPLFSAPVHMRNCSSSTDLAGRPCSLCFWNTLPFSPVVPIWGALRSLTLASQASEGYWRLVWST